MHMSSTDFILQAHLLKYVLQCTPIMYGTKPEIKESKKKLLELNSENEYAYKMLKKVFAKLKGILIGVDT